MFFLFTNCTSGTQRLTLDLHYVWKHISQPMQTLPLISLSVSSPIGHNLCEANPWKTLAPPPMWAADAWSKSPTPLWLFPVPAQLQEKPRGLSGPCQGQTAQRHLHWGASEGMLLKGGRSLVGHRPNSAFILSFTRRLPFAGTWGTLGNWNWGPNL